MVAIKFYVFTAHSHVVKSQQSAGFLIFDVFQHTTFVTHNLSEYTSSMSLLVFTFPRVTKSQVTGQ